MLNDDYVPRFEIIYMDGIKYKEIVTTGSQFSYLVAIDQFDYLNIINSSTGQVEKKLALKLHGQGQSSFMIFSSFLFVFFFKTITFQKYLYLFFFFIYL